MKRCSWLIVFSVALLWCCPPLYGARTYERLVNTVHQQYPQLRATSPLCIVLTSVQRCVGCGVLAVNGTLELVQQASTTATCVVMLFVEEEQEAHILREKFHTPFVVADTTPLFLASELVQHYPILLILDNKGNLLFRQADLQHNALHYPEVQKALAAVETPIATSESAHTTQSERRQEDGEVAARATQSRAVDKNQGGILLDEPRGYSSGNIMSPVVNHATQTLFAINPLTNAIDAWSTATGAMLFSLSLPDTLVYYFRPDAANKRWRDWEEQGATITQAHSLALAGDTLYLLVNAHSGYTEEKKYGRTPVGTMDTLVEITWKKRQLLASFYRQKLVNIVELPLSNWLLDIRATPAGGIGGTCLWYNFRRSVPIATQKDSLSFLYLYGPDKAVGVYQPALHDLQQALRMEKPEAYSLGSTAFASNGEIWYCDPNKNALFVIDAYGVLRRVLIKGELSSCEGGIVLSGAPLSQDATGEVRYALRGMLATPGALCVLLVPLNGTTAMPIAQLYTTAGEFIGEHAVSIPLEDEMPLLHIVDYNGKDATILAHTPGKRWRIIRIPLHFQSDALPVLGRSAKP